MYNYSSGIPGGNSSSRILPARSGDTQARGTLLATLTHDILLGTITIMFTSRRIHWHVMHAMGLLFPVSEPTQKSVLDY